MRQIVDIKSNEDLRQELERTFVRGEISALTWVSTVKSLSSRERSHIIDRIKKLEAFLRGELKADKDGTIARFVPDFTEGE
jgi:uncharacterized protein with von Willebrand factor type A (vWA) domain